MTRDRGDKGGLGWTNHEEEELAVAWRAGKSWNELADQFGRTVSGCENRIALLRKRGVELPNRKEKTHVG